MTIILHLIAQDVWAHAKHEPRYAPPSLAAEGFIHFSTPEQIPFVANRFYTGTDDLLLLVIESENLNAPLKYEAAAHPFPVPDSDELVDLGDFPHLYGPINLDAVVNVIPYAPGPDGKFAPPQL